MTEQEIRDFWEKWFNKISIKEVMNRYLIRREFSIITKKRVDKVREGRIIEE
jgi:hypothetical protein